MPWESVAKTPPKTDMFDVVSDNALEGATFGIGNRAQAVLAALVESGINGKPISENYKTARNIETERLGDEMKQHPVASIGSNIVGALATGGLGAETKAGSAIADSLRSGSLPLRMLKGAGAGAASGAAYGAGTAGYDQTAEGAQQGAITGALTGGAIPAAGAALSDVGRTAATAAKGLFARAPEAVQDAAESMKNTAGALYNQMRQVGATFNPQATKNLISNIGSAVASKQFIPELNPKTLAIVNHITEAAKTGALGLDDLDQYRRLLGRIGPTEDGVSAGQVRSAIDDFVKNAGQKDLASGDPTAFSLLNQGRKQYQQASKFEDISDILTKADGDPNKIKSGLTRFLNNEKNTKGWSDEEIQALKDAAGRTGTEQIMRGLGTFGFDLGHTKNIALPALASGGALAAPAVGVPAVVGGTIARQGSKLAARGGAENLLNTLQNGGGNALPKTPISGLFSAPAAGIATQIENPHLPATGNIGDQNLQQLQQIKQTLPAGPPQSSLPDVSNFAKAESSNNPNAKNSNSSASGLYQFTNKTWASMVGRYGKQTGIDLGDKNNPQAQATMAALYAKDNIASLQNTLGRMPTKGELYMAHVLGASGAAKLINADPNKEAIMLYPRQVFDANREIFFNGRQPRTVAEVYQLLNHKVT